MQKEIHCNECDASFTIKHSLNDTYYEINFCSFCGKEIWEEDEHDVEDDE